MIKHCKKCQIEKPIDQFGKDRSRTDGVYPTCKTCVAEKQKIVRKRHNEKRTAYNKKYREENREHYNQWERQYYAVNKDRLSMNAKSWRERRNGTIMMMHLSAQNRAKRKGLVYELNPQFISVIMHSQGDKCVLTGIDFVFENDGKYRYRPFAPSIDRKSSNKGYTLDNIQITVCIVNKAKNEYPIELFDMMCIARARKIENG